jgi:predicted transcriptional regulator
MKTTVEVSDALLRAAKKVAAEEDTTVRALIEEGLRKALEQREAAARFRLRDASFGAGGLRPDIREGSWERIRDLIYEGRGA